MTDTTDSDAESTPGDQSTTGFSRRGTLTALAGLFGLRPDRVAARDSQRIRRIGEERIDVDGETMVRLTAPESFVTDDGTEIEGGGSARIGTLNRIHEGVLGAAISGGGLQYPDADETLPNIVTANFGAIGGGAANRAGTDDENPENGHFTTVAGGYRNTASGALSVVSGGRNNTATAESATVSGGASNEATGARAVVAGGQRNRAKAANALVSGGVGNNADERYTTVSGGTGNIASAVSATVVGGRINIARGQRSTIVGGRGNYADARASTVAGGQNNDATGEGAFVAGGEDNTADGTNSFVAGSGADTNGKDGSFVVGNSTAVEFRARDEDTAYFQMPVNAWSFNNTSTRAAKRDIEPVDPESVLDSVRSLSVSTWEFERGDESTHMGPTAEDFQDTFDLGPDDETISTIDADGVALAAIQGLASRLDERDERIDELETELETKESRIEKLEAEVERVDALESRLDALESNGD